MKVKVTGINQAMKKLQDDLHKEKLKMRPVVANELVNQLEANTPKDTGFAAKSWKVEVVGNNVSIVNDAPYIDELNKGSSKQAPEFFIEKTILENKKVVPDGTIVSYR